MKAFSLKRSAVLAGMVGAAMLSVLLVPGTANANVSNPPHGSQPGNLTLNPTSGARTLSPTWSTTTGCPAGFQTNATLEVITDSTTSPDQQISDPVTANIATGPMSGTLTGGATMNDIFAIPLGPLGETFEFVIDCHATGGVHGQYVQSTFVTFNSDGTTWTSSPTPPAGSSGPVATTTSLVASPSTQIQGKPVVLSATVTGAGATGNVEFFNGATSLGMSPVSSGAASLTVSNLAVGANPITAQFEPTNTGLFTGSTSSVQTVTIVASSGDTGAESITVNVPLNEGVFTMTVSPNAVALSAPVLNGNIFDSTGTLSPVTVSDGRVQSKPGWSVSGQVSDFTAGGLSFSGDFLGWTPQITTPNAANDVVAGPAVPANSHPGLKEGDALANAAANKGLGTTVLGALLDLQIPNTTSPGNYSSVLTLTAVESAA
jgi:hypothetical protein